MLPSFLIRLINTTVKLPPTDLRRSATFSKMGGCQSRGPLNPFGTHDGNPYPTHPIPFSDDLPIPPRLRMRGAEKAVNPLPICRMPPDVRMVRPENSADSIWKPRRPRPIRARQAERPTNPLPTPRLPPQLELPQARDPVEPIPMNGRLPRLPMQTVRAPIEPLPISSLPPSTQMRTPPLPGPSLQIWFPKTKPPTNPLPMPRTENYSGKEYDGVDYRPWWEAKGTRVRESRIGIAI